MKSWYGSKNILGYIRLWKRSENHRTECLFCDNLKADLIRWLYYTYKQEG